MEEFSLLSEEKLSLSKVKRLLFGGDGDSWIISGIGDYIKLYTYISRNRQGITNQVNLKDKEIQGTGAIESNVNQVIASRFKKRGMSWSIPGALSLLKIKETILNNQWDLWWEEGRKQNLKVGKFNPPLSASYFKEDTESSFLLEVALPALKRPD